MSLQKWIHTGTNNHQQPIFGNAGREQSARPFDLYSKQQLYSQVVQFRHLELVVKSVKMLVCSHRGSSWVACSAWPCRDGSEVVPCNQWICCRPNRTRRIQVWNSRLCWWCYLLFPEPRWRLPDVPEWTRQPRHPQRMRCEVGQDVGSCQEHSWRIWCALQRLRLRD